MVLASTFNQVRDATGWSHTAKPSMPDADPRERTTSWTVHAPLDAIDNYAAAALSIFLPTL